MKAYEDPNHPANGPEHHTGKKCIAPGCNNPAGTAWSPFWCQSCNANRMNRIDESMRDIEAKMKSRANTQRI